MWFSVIAWNACMMYLVAFVYRKFSLNEGKNRKLYPQLDISYSPEP